MLQSNFLKMLKFRNAYHYFSLKLFISMTTTIIQKYFGLENWPVASITYIIRLNDFGRDFLFLSQKKSSLNNIFIDFVSRFARTSVTP